MIDYKNSKGYRIMYDDTLQPGDLITAYQKGYHEFISMEDRGKETAPLISYRRKYNFNGKPIKSKEILKCDAAYCRKAQDHIKASIQEKEAEIGRLQDILYPPND